MSRINVKQKGAKAERDVIAILQPVANQVCDELGVTRVELIRNLNQSRAGGYDIEGVDWMALEVKHQTQDGRTQWWEQTKRQAGENQEPVLFYKLTGTRWRVRMFGRLQIGKQFVRCPVDIDPEAFVAYFRLRLKKELTQIE